MLIRKAEKNDLQSINNLYEKVVEKMERDGLHIWNHVYPFVVFEEDIENENMYLVFMDYRLISGFSLLKFCDGEDSINWEKKDSSALYLFRLALDPDLQGKEVAVKIMEEVEQFTDILGYEYLRLFVVDNNFRALGFYEKCSYERRDGVFEDIVNGRTLREYGFEKKVSHL